VVLEVVKQSETEFYHWTTFGLELKEKAEVEDNRMLFKAWTHRQNPVSDPQLPVFLGSAARNDPRDENGLKGRQHGDNLQNKKSAGHILNCQ
jgi:hypothetical protein